MKISHYLALTTAVLWSLVATPAMRAQHNVQAKELQQAMKLPPVNEAEQAAYQNQLWYIDNEPSSSDEQLRISKEVKEFFLNSSSTPVLLEKWSTEQKEVHKDIKRAIAYLVNNDIKIKDLGNISGIKCWNQPWMQTPVKLYVNENGDVLMVIINAITWEPVYGVQKLVNWDILLYPAAGIVKAWK